MKGNFNIKKIDELESSEKETVDKKNDLTESEFEDYIRKSGLAGSFMVFRSDDNKDSELGMDEI
jgi:hypothetical protein